MRVILDLDELVLGKLQEQADSLKRSRKNYMEYLLEMKSVNNNPILERIKVEEKQIDNAISENLKNPPTQTRGVEMYVAPYESPTTMFESYKEKIWATKSYDALEKVVKAFRLEIGTLSKVQRGNLEGIATAHSEEQGFYSKG